MMIQGSYNCIVGTCTGPRSFGLLVDLVNIVVRGHWLCSPLCLSVLGVAGEEMDYVLLLKWSGDTTQKHYRQNHWDWGRRKPGNWKAGEIKALWNYLINLRRLNTNYLRNLPSSSRLDTTHILDRTYKFSFKIEILNDQFPPRSKMTRSHNFHGWIVME